MTTKLELTALDIAQRYVGVHETAGASSNPSILAMLRLDNSWPQDDDVAWCSAFVNWICWLVRLPRSKSLAARSWLLVGTSIALDEAVPGFDVVILKRGGGDQPGPEVLKAPGHVGFFAGLEDDGRTVIVLGGNQGDSVSNARFPAEQVIGVRRLL